MIDAGRLERLRAKRLAEDERLVCMERAGILLEGQHMHASLSRVARQAAVLRDLCDGITPLIEDEDIIVGRMPEVLPTDEDEAFIAEHPELFVEPGVPGWLDSISICVPEWDWLLTRGIGGIASYAAEQLATLADHGQGCEHRREFLQSAVAAMEAVSALVRRYASAARRLALLDERAERRRELEEVAGRCERVAWEPPVDLLEALQLLQIVHMVLSCLVGGRDVTPGRVDQYLLPFYRASIARGQVTRDDAVTLLAMWFLRLSQTAGNASDFDSNQRRSPCRYSHLYTTVGGMDREGNSAVNEMSFVVGDAIRRLGYKEPTLLFRYHSGIDPALTEQVAELMGDRLPVTVYNDETVIPGLIEHGVPEPVARGYAHSACHNVIVPGWHAGSGPGGFYNVPRMILLAMNGGRDPVSRDRVGAITAELDELATFEDFWGAFTEQVRFALAAARAASERRWVEQYRDATPLLHSCLMRRSLDTHQSCWTAAPISHLNHYLTGVATAVDSLLAIRELAFENDTTQRIGLARLAQILACDWSGHERLRQRIRASLPRYGQDHPEARELTARLGRLWVEEVRRASEGMTRLAMWPAFYSHMAHLREGSRTAATPDGRQLGEPLSENLSPSAGTPGCSPTSILLSITALPLHCTPSGAATLALSLADLGREKRAAVVRGLMEGYFDLGGHHLQVNVVNREALVDAVRNPEAHRDLMVRVAGFSAYFVLLPEPEQQDIIRRYER